MKCECFLSLTTLHAGLVVATIISKLINTNWDETVFIYLCYWEGVEGVFLGAGKREDNS